MSAGWPQRMRWLSGHRPHSLITTRNSRPGVIPSIQVCATESQGAQPPESPNPPHPQRSLGPQRQWKTQRSPAATEGQEVSHQQSARNHSPSRRPLHPEGAGLPRCETQGFLMVSPKTAVPKGTAGLGMSAVRAAKHRGFLAERPPRKPCPEGVDTSQPRVATQERTLGQPSSPVTNPERVPHRPPETLAKREQPLDRSLTGAPPAHSL